MSHSNCQITFHKNCMKLQFQWQRGLVSLHPYQYLFWFLGPYWFDSLTHVLLAYTHTAEALTCLWGKIRSCKTVSHWCPSFCEFPVPRCRDGEMGVGRDWRYLLMIFYPIDILADLGIDTWVIGLAAKETSPGHQGLQGVFAHQWSPWVTVAGTPFHRCWSWGCQHRAWSLPASPYKPSWSLEGRGAWHLCT